MMTSATLQLRQWLHAFDFRSLLVEGLGWNRDHAEPLHVQVDGRDYALDRVAEKAGFVVYVCQSSAGGTIPEYPVRRKIEQQVARLTFEHMIVFVDAGRTEQCWQWVKRESGKPAAYREHSFRADQTGEPLLQRLQTLAFDLQEEAGLTVPVVASRVQQAMDVEKVTKRFYERFRTELEAFQGFVDGIVEQGDREWYASLMLNRMMFVYFIQKQGFLDSDVDYLRSRLSQLRSEGGAGRFQQFYRIFLLRLFHEGLGQPEADRAPDLEELLGKVPFLNGGLFDVHDLERDNPDISIPDEAFERVFGFFDSYQWHLDERPRRADNEINPDVLGYIFEKYINQKQMGAYYTKEDITGYISRSTVLPFLFDAARKECPIAFEPGGGVWRLLQDDPDRYIYPSVGHGVAWSYSPDRDSEPLDMPLGLPGEIEAGLDDVSRRGGWNEHAPSEYALPTETWRELVARRQHYAEVRKKLAAGEISEINDLITLNLDIERFARDVIVQSEGPELLRAFWHALRDVSILDPTCGSGAFLFAALNILEPLYAGCLEGMQGFLDDLERSERPHHPETMRDFRAVLEQVGQHPSERYFVLKSIVLNNLYGVDIMEEAVEICKLRLFLKLVAQLETYDQIEPLPDIDFNIRAGNTLVGFSSLEAVRRAMTITPDGRQFRAPDPKQVQALARIEEEAEVASAAFGQFRQQQTLLGGEVTSADKEALRTRLRRLDDELDRYLAVEYGIDPGDAVAFGSWRAGHQPFHWFVEFYEIMSAGGFNVVIGNPPYVKRRSIDYGFTDETGEEYPDIYGHVALQSTRLTNRAGRGGLIVPLSLTFSRDFASLRRRICDWGTGWFSSYDNIPAAIFTGVSQRCTIWLGHNTGTQSFAAPMYRWRAPARTHLMESLIYTGIGITDADTFGLPKVADMSHISILGKLPSPAQQRGAAVNRRSSMTLGFSQSARNFISVFLQDPPCLDARSLAEVSPSKVGRIPVSDGNAAVAALAATSGELFFWYWLTRGDGFDITSWILRDYLLALGSLPGEQYALLGELGGILDRDRNRYLVFKKNAGRYVGNYNYRPARRLTRRADLLMASGLSLSAREIVGLFDYTEKVLAINEYAGEKGIPLEVKAMFPTSNSLGVSSTTEFARIDSLLSEHFGMTVEELDAIVSTHERTPRGVGRVAG